MSNAVTPNTLDIASLLARRNTRLIEPGGDTKSAESRADLTRLIGERYRSFYPLRRAIAAREPMAPRGAVQRLLLENLMHAGLLQPAAGAHAGTLEPVDDDANLYLTGGWLEELAYLATLSAGADEVLLQQKLEWKAAGVTGHNEIDVLARNGETLIFVSCKAAHPELSAGRATRERFRDFLLETDYWDSHFSDGSGKAVLMIATDLMDESGATPRHRYPTLFARAHVLEVDIVSLDLFRWELLVPAFCATIRDSQGGNSG